MGRVIKRRQAAMRAGENVVSAAADSRLPGIVCVALLQLLTGEPSGQKASGTTGGCTTCVLCA